MQRILGVLLLLLCFSVSAVFAQVDCPLIVERALQSVTDHCASIGRNQACYGSVQLTAEPRAGVNNFVFNAPGDIVNLGDTQVLELGNEIDTSQWGVALLQVQANLPDTLPGQNVTMLLFGNVQVENAVPALVEITATVTSNARVRSAPTTEQNNVVAGLTSGTSVTVNGRTEAGDWARIVLSEDSDQAGTLAWVSASVLNFSEDFRSLTVVDVETPHYTTMQAFYFTSGVGDRPCAQAPDSGLLIQTPEGVGMMSFIVNGVSISLGSTLYLQAANNVLSVAVIEGQSVVRANDVSQYIPAGTFSEIPLDSAGEAPAGAPNAPEPYDVQVLAALPVSVTLPRVVTVAPPIAQGDIEVAIHEIAIENGVLPGTYLFTPTGEDSQFGSPGCGWAPPSTTFTTSNGHLWFDPTTVTETSPGVFTGTQNYDAATSTSSTLTILSPTEFLLQQSWRWGTGTGDATGCDKSWDAVWVST